MTFNNLSVIITSLERIAILDGLMSTKDYLVKYDRFIDIISQVRSTMQIQKPWLAV